MSEYYIVINVSRSLQLTIKYNWSISSSALTTAAQALGQRREG